MCGFWQEQNGFMISCLLQVAILITGTPSVKSVCPCWLIWTIDLYPIMTLWQPMAEPSHYALEVKGRHFRRHQVWYLENISTICLLLLSLFPYVTLYKYLQFQKIQWVQGLRYWWKPQSQCLLAPLVAPQRALWCHHSLLTWTAHLHLLPCVVLLLLRNKARRGQGHCRARMRWGEALNSGPHPQVRAVHANHCLCRGVCVQATRGNSHLNWRHFGWLYYLQESPHKDRIARMVVGEREIRIIDRIFWNFWHIIKSAFKGNVLSARCLGLESQVNGSPPSSTTSVPSPKLEPSKPSLLSQFLLNRKEQVLYKCHILSALFTCWC